MSINGITFSGLASGIDTRAIIDALMAVERRPIFSLESKKSLYSTQKKLFGDLDGKLHDLLDAADDLRKTNRFLEYQAAVDNSDYLTASASTGASAGTYDVVVKNLAAAQIKSSLGKADQDVTSYGPGTISFMIDGAAVDVTLGGAPEDSTLQGIASAINSTSGLGVQAQVLDTGIGANPYQLVLTSKETGTAHTFTMSTDGGAALSALVAEIDGNEILAASDALISINQIDVQRSSNTISDAIEGVTLNLKQADLSASTTVTISTDLSGTSKKIQDFVDAYNAVVDFMESQSVAGGEGSTASPLFGDSTLRNIRYGLRQIVGGSVSSVPAQFQLASFVGISADTSGKLEFDQSEFEEALNEDEAAVRGLFSNSDGIATLLYDKLDLITDSVDGLIVPRQEGYDDLIKRANDSIDRTERRLEQVEANLVQRFANLEATLNLLQNQGNSLSSLNLFGFSQRK